MFASTPKPPYYAVIFTSLRTDNDDAYGDTATRMVELAAGQPGFLGVESARGVDGLGITVSYWASEEAIAHWKRDAEHTLARERGRKDWYAGYETRVAKVERAYSFRQPALTLVTAADSDITYVLDQTLVNMADVLPADWGKAELEHSWHQCENRIIHLDQQAIGVLRWRVLDGGLHITDFQIAPPFRRRGLARLALAQLGKLARSSGLTRLSLHVAPANTPAIALYEQSGFSLIGTVGHQLRFEMPL